MAEQHDLISVSQLYKVTFTCPPRGRHHTARSAHFLVLANSPAQARDRAWHAMDGRESQKELFGSSAHVALMDNAVRIA